MRKLIALLAVLIPAVGHADVKISGMVTTSTMSATDIFPVVINPQSNAVNRSITLNNLSNVLSSVTVTNASGLPLRLENPTVGPASMGILFTNTGTQTGFIRKDNYTQTCSDLTSSCIPAPFEFGSLGVTNFYITNDGRFFSTQGTSGFLSNLNSSVVGGSLIVGGNGTKNYTDTQQIGDGNLLVNNGVIASTINLQGIGNGQITLTISQSTFTVLSASGPLTPGQYLVLTSTNGTLVAATPAGTASGSQGQIQYNNGGNFAGISGTLVTASSITFSENVKISTLAILSPGGTSANIGLGSTAFLDVSPTNIANGSTILAVGSSGQGNMLIVQSGLDSPVQMIHGGATIGSVRIGAVANTNRLQASGDIHNYVDLRSSNTMQFHTDGGGAPGTLGDMMFWPGEVNMLTLSTATGVTMTVPTGVTPYELTVGTATQWNVAFSTGGFQMSYGTAPTISSCGSGPVGSVVGDDNRGVITVGGSAPTACTLTFSMVHAGCTMACTITANSLTIAADISSLTNSAMTLGFGVGGLAGGTVWYQCSGYGSTCK